MITVRSACEVVQNGLPEPPCTTEVMKENVRLALAETNVMEVHGFEPPFVTLFQSLPSALRRTRQAGKPASEMLCSYCF